MRVAWEILIVHPLPVAVVETAGLAEITGIQTHSTMVAVGGEGGGRRAPMMTGRREGAGDNLVLCISQCTSTSEIKRIQIRGLIYT